MTYRLVIRSRDEEPVYTRPVAAQLAQVSIEFLRLCEEENLIQVQVMAGGGQGYSVAHIRHLARIRRLHEDLELDLPAVEVVMNLRLRVLDLMTQMDEVERRAAQREQELIDEIRLLRRRLAEKAEWR
jgi:DNA-binding transcriptional MerR regulator